MAIQQFNEDVEVISKLGDLPNQDDGLTAEELKAKFDQASIAIKNFINNVLVPVIRELEAAKDPEYIYGLDTTLSQEGRAAEAAAVGNELKNKFGLRDTVPVANGGTGGASIAAAQESLHVSQYYLFAQIDPDTGNKTSEAITSYPLRPGVFRVTTGSTGMGLPANYGCLVIFNGGSYYGHLYVAKTGFWYGYTGSLSVPATWNELATTDYVDALLG